MNPRFQVLTSLVLFGAAATVAGCAHEAPPPVVASVDDDTPMVEPAPAPPPTELALPETSPPPAAPTPDAIPTVPALDAMAAVFEQLSAARARSGPPATEPTIDAALACVGTENCDGGWIAHAFDSARQRWFTLAERPSDERDIPTPPMLELTTTDARGSSVVSVPENQRGAARIRRALGSVPRSETMTLLESASVRAMFNYFDGYAWHTESFPWVLALEGPLAGWALWTAPNAGTGFVLHLSRLDRTDDRIVFELPGRDGGCSGDLTYLETDAPAEPPADPSSTGFDGYHACWPPWFADVVLAPDHRSLLLDGYRTESPEAPASEAVHVMVALPPDLVPAP